MQLTSILGLRCAGRLSWRGTIFPSPTSPHFLRGVLSRHISTTFVSLMFTNRLVRAEKRTRNVSLKLRPAETIMCSHPYYAHRRGLQLCSATCRYDGSLHHQSCLVGDRPWFRHLGRLEPGSTTAHIYAPFPHRATRIDRFYDQRLTAA